MQPGEREDFPESWLVAWRLAFDGSPGPRRQTLDERPGGREGFPELWPVVWRLAFGGWPDPRCQMIGRAERSEFAGRTVAVGAAGGSMPSKVEIFNSTVCDFHVSIRFGTYDFVRMERCGPIGRVVASGVMEINISCKAANLRSE